ncbi:MAG: NUDIX hydrolase [Candidatus Diapherotrites archaeon]|nr:NUDIX hydrolase [Candidatus Diapherotrites archaeon]
MIVLDGSKLLLVKTFEGWTIPGGLVEKGEFLEETATRECFEETGLRVETKGLFKFSDDPKRDPNGHGIVFIFNAVVVGGKLRPSGEGVPDFVDVFKLKDSEVNPNTLSIVKRVRAHVKK